MLGDAHPSGLQSFHVSGSLPALPVSGAAVSPHLVHSSSAQHSTGKGKFTRDKSGRLHLTWPRTGPLHIYLRSSKFYSSNAVGHCRDLRPLIVQQQKKGKNFVVLLVDGGPDWSVRSTATIVQMGKLWRDCGLDLLVAVSYAPYHSRYNPIEHAWSPRSNDLIGVV